MTSVTMGNKSAKAQELLEYKKTIVNCNHETIILRDFNLDIRKTFDSKKCFANQMIAFGNKILVFSKKGYLVNWYLIDCKKKTVIKISDAHELPHDKVQMARFGQNIIVRGSEKKNDTIYKIVKIEGKTLNVQTVNSTLIEEYQVPIFLVLPNEIIYFIQTSDKFYSVSTRDGVTMQNNEYDHLSVLLSCLTKVKLLTYERKEMKNNFILGGLNENHNVTLIYSDGREHVLFTTLHLGYHTSRRINLDRTCFCWANGRLVVASSDDRTIYLQEWALKDKWEVTGDWQLRLQRGYKVLVDIESCNETVILKFDESGESSFLVFDLSNGEECAGVFQGNCCVLDDGEIWREKIMQLLLPILKGLSRDVMGLVIGYIV